MSQAKSLNVKVATRPTPSGGVWSLWWPRWKWNRLTPEEQRQVVERQTRLMQRSNHAKETSKVGQDIQ